MKRFTIITSLILFTNFGLAENSGSDMFYGRPDCPEIAETMLVLYLENGFTFEDSLKIAENSYKDCTEVGGTPYEGGWRELEEHLYKKYGDN